MPNPILKQAVVIGAGMGGLAAAKAVAPGIIGLHHIKSHSATARTRS